MSIKSNIEDSKTGKKATVGLGGTLSVGPPQFSTAFNAELAVDNTVVNIVPAKANHIFVLTDILLKANKNVDNVTDAVVDIYEANSTTSTTILNTIMSVPLERSGRIVMNGVFFGTDVSTYINGKTSDDDVFVTLFGYYVKV